MFWTTTLALAALAAATQESRPFYENRAIAIVERLRKIGYPIDLGRLTLAVKLPEEVRADIDRQQDVFFRPSYFDGMHLFYSALGVDAGADGAELRRSGVEAMANTFRAYYQADRKSLVFLQSGRNELLDSLSGIEPIVAHELVHAHQDQIRGLEERIRANRDSMERLRIFQCLMEGEAEIVALAQGIRETGGTLETLSVEDLESDLERLLAGEALTLVYSAGRKFMLERFHEGGWNAVRASFEKGPSSTEQLLHPEKLGQDEPREVTLPVLDLELVHDDVMGELETYKVLLLVQSSRNVAYTAAVGWDGDRLRAYTGEDGAFAVVWRTVWDREVDSRQFSDVLADVGGTTVRRGRSVDWVAASTEELEEEVLTRLETTTEK